METHLEAMAVLERDSAAFAYARRLREAADFELLKARMLMRAMDEIPPVEFHVLIFRAAEEATGLARQTPFPRLVFPGLFEERVEAVRQAAERRNAAFVTQS